MISEISPNTNTNIDDITNAIGEYQNRTKYLKAGLGFAGLLSER